MLSFRNFSRPIDQKFAIRPPPKHGFRIAPKRVWAVADSTATLRNQDLGLVRPLPVQARLGDFRLPQRGICVVGHGRFDPFDPYRHRNDRLGSFR